MVEFTFRGLAVWVIAWSAAVLAATALWGLPGYCVGMGLFTAASGLAMWRHRRPERTAARPLARSVRLASGGGPRNPRMESAHGRRQAL